MEYNKFMEAIAKNGFTKEDAKQGGVAFLGSQRDLEAGIGVVEDDETPIGIVGGQFFYTGPGTSGINNAILILTNERLIKADKKLKNTDFTFFYIDDLNSVEHKTAFLSSRIIIRTTSGIISVEKVKKDTGGKFSSELTKLMRESKKSKKVGTTIHNAASGMDEIKKAKALLDDGIISKEEFDAIKKKHL